jgi:signal transduction histidine kinase
MESTTKEMSGINPSELPVAWCRLGSEGAIVESNELCSALLQLPILEIKGRLFQSFYDGDSAILAKILSLLPDTQGMSFRGWLKRGDGSKFPAIINASKSTTAPYSQGVNLVLVDDSLEYYGQEKARLENESSKQKDQLKNEFIAIASHELRTPIQPILGFALLAKRGKIGQEQAWDGVLKEARRLQQLANDILDVSRIESNTVTYKMESLKINDLVQSILDSAKTDLKKEILFELDSENPDQEIEADRSRLTQVITNLVNNASKFTNQGSVRVSTRLLKSDDQLEIRVTDTGTGIPEEILPRLFTKFVSKDHGSASTNQGTGLGLFICKAIVTAHKGKISARNIDNGGAEFMITLPLTQSQQKE